MGLLDLPSPLVVYATMPRVLATPRSGLYAWRLPAPPPRAHKGHALLLAHSAMPHLVSGEKREGGCCGEEEE